MALANGDQRAIVVEVGGALRSYEVVGWELLDGYPPDEICGGARGQSLISWPNRLRDGRYEFDGETYQLPLSEPARRNAIHGLTRWANWKAPGWICPQNQSPVRALDRPLFLCSVLAGALAVLSVA